MKKDYLIKFLCIIIFCIMGSIFGFNGIFLALLIELWWNLVIKKGC